jgi:hypothetical protein
VSILEATVPARGAWNDGIRNKGFVQKPVGLLDQTSLAIDFIGIEILRQFHAE